MNETKKWKITYIDSKSRGKKCVTYYTGNKSREEIILFFGLDEPDCYWYELEIVNN